MSISSPIQRPFLEVKDLNVRFQTDDGLVQAVTGSTFSLEKGRTLGIVGESGSGKSVTSLAMLGLHRTRMNAKVTGEIWLDDQELVTATDEQVRLLRGGKIAMIFQDPLSAMHPYFTVGSQIVEAYRIHHPGVNKKVARERAIEMLARVGIPQPERRFNDYAHQFSGGMRQRAMIAMALVNDPALLIADEPTTALDVTVQAQILDLIRDLQEEFGSAVIMITHDLGVVAELADDVLVMYGGKIIEKGPALDVFKNPQHPYTWGLLGSMPRLDRDVRDRLTPVKGSPPSLINLPNGCAFNPRCPYAGRNGDRSFTEVPMLRDDGHSAGHLVACHLPAEDRRKIFQEEVLPNL
ncbi:ABC transporter ATP-binding protein [Paractinoplanes rhizophilus]|jgi:peptide/nickel transport system ATP-binding protein|uniref:ABC transporter ATP-binding protein n=1 Tax=Paractinoplanes rhizophilus TaxID=1416877 RepID=A0ABW2HYB5_9ACTN|nr:ABC transporter ATP-binding protein [Actinoplanes sp.]